MIAIVLIGIAAGTASALMFASIISRALISLLLAYLASLPLMVAALGWGPLAAAVGGIAAAVGIGAIFGFGQAIAYAVTIALPAWWLGHLAMLGRPADNDTPPPSQPLEWYPIGHILLWIAALGAIITIATIITVTTDAEAITAAMKRFVSRALAIQRIAADERTIETVATLVQAAIVVGPMMMLTINLWLAAKIAATSGRLKRPWPDLKATTLPPMTLVAVCVAIALCFTGGLLEIFARITAGALLMAYAVVGFAVLHTLTVGLKGRGFWLTISYTMVVVSGGLLPVMSALGIADAIFKFRQRFLQRRPPPLPAS